MHYISGWIIHLLVPLSVMGQTPGTSGTGHGVDASPDAPQSRFLVIHVPGDHATIQDAIDTARMGSLLLVAPGTYMENIDFKGKAITLRSDLDGMAWTHDLAPESTVIDEDPLFVDPLNRDFRLQSASPCIDVGDNTVPDLFTLDLDGDPRIRDGDGDTIAVVDIGADAYSP